MFQGYSLTAPLLPVIVNIIARFCFWMRGKREGWMGVSRVFCACLENTDVVGFLFVECTYVGLSRELLKQLHVLLGGHPRASLGSLSGLLPFSSPLLNCPASGEDPAWLEGCFSVFLSSRTVFGNLNLHKKVKAWPSESGVLPSPPTLPSGFYQNW